MVFFVRVVRLVISLVFAAVVLVGCTSGGAGVSAIPGGGQFFETASTGPAGTVSAPGASAIFAENAASDEAGDDYRISPLDELEIQVYGVKELDRTVQVSSGGMISLPLVKTVRAGGKTANELEQDIAAKLEASYLQSPQVSVFVKAFNSQRITVEGAVKKPGIYPTTGKVSLLQAVALAEGLNSVGDPSGVLLFRAVNGKRMAARFDLQQVRAGTMEDPVLQAGDIVMVDESRGRTTLRDIKEALPMTGLFQMLLL